MKRLVRYPLEDGGSVLVEVEELEPGMVPAAPPGDIAVRAQQSFEAALETIRPTAGRLIAKLREIGEAPGEIAVEFGLSLGFEAGAIIASGSTNANFKVTLTWKGKE